jgi:shikimate dehydrogenase
MAFEVGNQQLADVLTGFRGLNLRGFNVSMPNKMKILPYLDEVTPAARFIGAVNTVVNEDGKFVGCNTDGVGYVRGLKENGVDIKRKKMTVMGAGGAASAVAIQCAIDGAAEIHIFNRNDESYDRAVKNADIINNEIGNCRATVHHIEDEAQLRASIEESDILTNATGVGMKPLEDQSIIPNISWLRPELIVTDVVYIPRKTKLLEMAESVGCKTINGLGMMLWQGAEAFKMWTGHKMPVEYVKEQLF